MLTRRQGFVSGAKGEIKTFSRSVPIYGPIMPSSNSMRRDLHTASLMWRALLNFCEHAINKQTQRKQMRRSARYNKGAVHSVWGTRTVSCIVHLISRKESQRRNMQNKNTRISLPCCTRRCKTNDFLRRRGRHFSVCRRDSAASAAG